MIGKYDTKVEAIRSYVTGDKVCVVMKESDHRGNSEVTPLHFKAEDIWKLAHSKLEEALYG